MAVQRERRRRTLRGNGSDLGLQKLSNIAQWLSGLGLEKYVSAFADAEIDFADLPYLTDEDLKEVGLPVGPRRRVNEAIKRLADGAGSPSPDGENATPAAGQPNEAAPAQQTEAERRHLTVMFVDLVGSTEMATKIDPEDMRNVITSYQNTVAGVVARYEGFVAKFMGDGVLCYFGWPRANEDDAERAVRAGLDIISAVKASSGPEGGPLASRVGIATGVVIVGDLIGSGATQEAAVVGETPNLAARLQGLAEPDQLVLPRETQSLLGNIFDLKPIGAHGLKGIADPVDAYVVMGEAARESRFDARQSGTLAAIVGREQELELMSERWAKAKAGSGQMILVSGEAGIGKSRITRAVMDGIAQDDHIRLTYQCSPYHTDSAFYPIIQQMTFAAGILPTDGNLERLEKLEGVVGTDPENTALMALLLGIDANDRYDPLDLTPAQIRARTMRALISQLVQQAEGKPLLAIFEDLHWVDPTTLELLDMTLDAITGKAILILATARPTFEHGFGGHPIVTRFALNRLGREHTLSIVNKLTDGKSLPAEVMEIITDRTDGVPLFVEELTKTILESEVLIEAGDRLVLDGPLDTLAIPSTLHDSLMARLDRLQPIKEVAQTAACIGREFEHQLLAAISPLMEADLNTALEGLIKAELVYRRGVPPEAIYLFKHALVRDAAYESLLKERRRNIHDEILAALEEYPDIAPEVRAHHAEAAGQTERAIDLWEVASKAAIARPAYDEGISHLKRAIALISPRMEGQDRAVLELALSLQIQLGFALLSRAGYGADETKSAFEHALALADKIGDTPMRYSVLYGLWAGMHLRSKHAEALSQAEALVLLAEASAETAPLVVANRLVATSLGLQGRFSEAQTDLDRALSIYDPVRHTGLANQFGQDIGTSVHCYSGLNLMVCGETGRAGTQARKAEEAALASSHANTIVYMHLHLAIFALLSCDEGMLERHTAAIIPIAGEQNLVLWLGYVANLQELTAARKGDESSIQRYLQADADIVATKSTLFVPLFRIEAARRALAMGFREPAIKLAAMARQIIVETGETFALADLCRLEGALAVDAGNIAEAETHLTEAIDVAREQGGKLWELRAAIDLARLWHVNGRTVEASALLQPIHDGIADGDCPEDRATAQGLLAEF